MSTTLKRTSMALDQESLQILDSLSHEWEVSKAEVIRRSLKDANEKRGSETKRQSPMEALQWLQENGISEEVAREWKAEIKAEREARVDPWAGYLKEAHEPASS